MKKSKSEFFELITLLIYVIGLMSMVFIPDVYVKNIYTVSAVVFCSFCLFGVVLFVKKKAYWLYTANCICMFMLVISHYCIAYFKNTHEEYVPFFRWAKIIFLIGFIVISLILFKNDKQSNDEQSAR